MNREVFLSSEKAENRNAGLVHNRCFRCGSVGSLWFILTPSEEGRLLPLCMNLGKHMGRFSL